MWKTAITLLLISVGLSHYFLFPADIPVPDLPETFWGPEKNRHVSTEIRPFKIDVPQSVIDDLKQRLANARLNVEPLEDVAWTYGISSTTLKKIIEYWRTKYNWTERQALLNKYPQFMTNIQGLDIHFYHVKPTNLPKDRKIKVLPLLMVHGWPGSVVEFQKIIPILTTPRSDRDFVFEVIAPSLPGYGFSDCAVRPGLGPAQISVIFKNLMTRLGFEKFYTQGGDWGSSITANLAILFPDRVIGTHLNMCFANLFSPWLLVGSIFPSLVVEKELQHHVYPLTKTFKNILAETGYMHLQATKPDTIGLALSNSPASLAAYILEKFSTWTNKEYKFREDGGLTEKFTLDELLDNLMVYWITNSITSSARLYLEHFTQRYSDLQMEKLPVPTPTACAIFPNEILLLPKKILDSKYPNIVQHNYLPRGGHFAAFEEPQLLADDIFSFVDKVEVLSKKKEKKENQVPKKVDEKQPKAT